MGDIVGPIDSRQGFHIAKVTGKNSYDDADKRQIRAAVFDEKRAKLFNEYFDKLKKQYHIQVNKDALKAAASAVNASEPGSFVCLIAALFVAACTRSAAIE